MPNQPVSQQRIRDLIFEVRKLRTRWKEAAFAEVCARWFRNEASKKEIAVLVEAWNKDYDEETEVLCEE